MKRPDPTTPLTETLDAWTARYGLTPEEREVLFCEAEGHLETRVTAKATGLEPGSVKACGAAVARKSDAKDLRAAALRLLREALALASFDREKRGATREESDDGDDD